MDHRSPSRRLWRAFLAGLMFFCGPAADGVAQEKAAGRSNPLILLEKKDTRAPVLRLLAPQLGDEPRILVRSEPLRVSGTVADESGIKRVEINGQVTAVRADGAFSTAIPLEEGLNGVVITAEDSEGNAGMLQFEAVLDIRPPTIEILSPRVAGTRGIYNVAEEILPVRGKVTDESGIQDVAVNGERVLLDADSTFTVEIVPKKGVDTVLITAIDVGGHRTEKRLLLRAASKETRPAFLSGTAHALVIGIDTYRGAWDPLKNAVRDARAVEQLLKTRFQFESVYTLYNDQATRAAIVRTLEDLGKRLPAESSLLIYYSGHGIKEQPFNKGFWVPVDATERSLASYISNDDIQTLLRGMRQRHVLLVADACFAGDIFRGTAQMIENDGSANYYADVARRVSRKGLTSGGDEPVLDGGKDGHSVFAYYFLQALREIEGSYFDAGQVYERLRIPVGNNSEQKPEFHPIKSTGDEGGQFIFVRKP